MNTAQLKYPLKSHRKPIRIPSESEKLAELMGIAFGDGAIGNPWQLVISLNSVTDRDYAQYVSFLLTELFGIEVATRKRPRQNARVLVCSSTTLVDFLIEKGAVRGNKVAQQIDIPPWIHRKKYYEIAFVRGLVDTDGCLYIHRHWCKGKFNRNIGFCFTSGSLRLIHSVAAILKKLGIEPHITDKNRRIYLYGAVAVSRYLRIFGSSNPRIFELFNKWRGARVADRARLESG